jgi:hypothetical protein
MIFLVFVWLFNLVIIKYIRIYIIYLEDKVLPRIDPFLFALWTSVGIFLISCPLIAFLEFHFIGSAYDNIYI